MWGVTRKNAKLDVPGNVNGAEYGILTGLLCVRIHPYHHCQMRWMKKTDTHQNRLGLKCLHSGQQVMALKVGLQNLVGHNARKVPRALKTAFS